MPGRPPESADDQEVKGAFDKNPDRRRTEEPQTPQEPIVKPKSLKGTASKIWDEYAPICVAMRTMGRGDEIAFAKLCRLEAEYLEDPEDFQTSRMAIHLTFLERFGLAGKGSRAKLAIKSKEDKPKTGAAKYLNGPITTGPGNTLRQ
jgi:phage terminase small subunit